MVVGEEDLVAEDFVEEVEEVAEEDADSERYKTKV